MNHRTYTRSIATILACLMLILAGCSGGSEVNANTLTNTPTVDQTTTTAAPTSQTTTTSAASTTTTTSTTQPATSTIEEASAEIRGHTSSNLDVSKYGLITGTVAFDEPVTLPDGQQLTVGEAHLEDSYETDYGTETPSDGMQFLFVTVTAKNTVEEPIFEADMYSFGVQYEGTTEEPTTYYGDWNDLYDGSSRLHEGQEDSGFIMFEVPDDASIDDLAITYTADYYTMDTDVQIAWGSTTTAN